MGCDIHCYIEHKAKDHDHWNGFGGKINPGRNYWMFGVLAGVRSEVEPVVPPRGYPNDLDYEAFGDATIYISDTQTEDYKHEDGDIYYSRKHAEDCIKKGYCEFLNCGRSGNHWVTNSDHHTPSWMTTDEFELAIGQFLKMIGFQVGSLRLTGPEVDGALADSKKLRNALTEIDEYWAILAAMRCFELQGQEARLIFWFDN